MLFPYISVGTSYFIAKLMVESYNSLSMDFVVASNMVVDYYKIQMLMKRFAFCQETFLCYCYTLCIGSSMPNKNPGIQNKCKFL